MNRKLIPLVLLIITGGWFRFQGIIKNISYWNDESHTAYFSRAILEHGIPITNTGQHTGLYQLALYYITAVFFKLGGITEFAGRLPSVLVGTLVIALVFFIAKKISNLYVAYIAAFLIAFSQIQLAWSTQLRPYIWMELWTLLIAFLSYKNLENKKSMIDKYIIGAFLISLISSLFHGTGLFNFIIIALIFLYKIIIRKKYTFLIFLAPVVATIGGILFFSLSPIHRDLNIIFRINTDILHYRVFLQANYWWLILGAAMGSLFLLKHSRNKAIVFIGFPVIIFTLAIFKLNSQYVRYSLPAFPFLYILFGYGIYSFSKGKSIVMIALLFLFLTPAITKNKVLLQPRFYYTINGDMRENPMVDYKEAFKRIEQLIVDKPNTIIMDAWNDRVPWYLPNRPYIFLIQYRIAAIDPLFGEPMIATIGEYKSIRRKYDSGVILIENWESQTAYDLQQYIRNTEKHEFDIINVPYNEADKWSISIYSWGL